MSERILKSVFFGLILAHVIGLLYFGWSAQEQVFAPRDIPADSRTFRIPDGVTLTHVLDELHRRDLSPDPFYVRLIMVWNKSRFVVKKGTYRLPEQASTWDLLMLFDAGKVELLRVTIPEGWDKWQTAAHLGQHPWGDEADFMRWIDSPELISHIDPKASDLEGYLFPETYFFPKEASPREIVQTMVEHFISRTRTLRERLGDRGLTVRQWLALASMVEKETSLGTERGKIAGVFHNRLKKGMLLQCDPTIIYSLKLDGVYRGKIYKSQIKHDNPYNTYVYKGLPPGPIAGPGLGSLRAALEPEQTPYYYFVAKKDGSHHFSKTLKEHNRAVYKYLRKKGN